MFFTVNILAAETLKMYFSNKICCKTCIKKIAVGPKDNQPFEQTVHLSFTASFSFVKN